MPKNPDRFPPISAELMTALEKLYPDQSPEATDTLESIRFKSGQVAVVRCMRRHYDTQNKTILQGR